MLYHEAKSASVARPRDLDHAIERLNDFWGDKPVSHIRGDSCRLYAKRRKTAAGARKDLEVLRAAVNHYHGEYGLDVLPRFTMPGKSLPRERWLTRAEAAALLRAAMRGYRTRHLARFILIGLYTGTRPGAILALQWMPNTQGGWIDLEKGVMHRRAQGERVARNKLKPPVRIPPRLMAHLQRWKRKDKGLRYVVHFRGRPIIKMNKAFRAIRKGAKLDANVVPHTLRHTRATWLMQAGVEIWEASGSLGMTEHTLQTVYGHHHPDWQKNAADAY